MIDNSYSPLYLHNHSIPHGSILGPSIYIYIYIYISFIVIFGGVVSFYPGT